MKSFLASIEKPGIVLATESRCGGNLRRSYGHDEEERQTTAEEVVGVETNDNGGEFMKDVTLNNGIVMTDAEFVRDRGWDDDLTDFVATKCDLVNLADSLVDELLSNERFLELQSSRRELARAEYTSFRLDRVLDFLPPEIRDKMLEKLRLGREENRANIEKIDADLKHNHDKELPGGQNNDAEG